MVRDLFMPRSSFVILAKAGIHPDLPSLRSIPASAGMTSKEASSSRKRVVHASQFMAFAVALLVASTAVRAQTTQFAFDPTKMPVGEVFHYEKSTIDGQQSTRVSVYVLDRERIESLKWENRATSATLVQARMDWPRFSIREFKSWQLERGVPPELKGTLEANHDGTKLDVSFIEGRTVKISRWPWHSYDFDFVSLGLTLPHLRNPEADVIFWRTDVVFVGEGMDFAEVGGIRLHFEANELRNDRELRRYSIGGAGLEHRYGKLWTDVRSGNMVEYQIPVGDEPGYRDVHVRLDRTETMSPSQWESFKRAMIGER
jgi:hypothetical protein